MVGPEEDLNHEITEQQNQQQTEFPARESFIGREYQFRSKVPVDRLPTPSHSSSTYYEINKNVRRFALCASLNSVNLGYDIGVYTGASDLIQDDLGLSDTELEIFIGSVNVFAMLGTVMSALVSEWWGRRTTFIASGFIFLVGCIVTSLAEDYLTLMTGRFFVGIGVGCGLAIDPMYISEISPPEHRGYLVTWSEFSINIGIVVGFLSFLVYAPLRDSLQWRIMVITGVVMPTIMIYLSYSVIPESPQWLVQEGNIDEARIVLKNLNPEGTDIEEILESIKRSLEEEEIVKKNVGWDAIFKPTPAVKRMLVVGLGTAIGQQATGIDAIQYYMIEILEDVGIEGDYEQASWLILIGVLKVAVIFYAALNLDKFGRRFLLQASTFGMMISCIILSFNFYLKEYPSVTIIGLIFYMTSFSLGMGPVAWLLPSEIFFTTIRPKAMSLATFANRTFAALMASTVLTAEDTIGWGSYFLILAVICALFLIFFIKYQPETTGMRLEDMARYFADITGDESIVEELLSLQNSLSAPFISSVSHESSDVSCL